MKVSFDFDDTIMISKGKKEGSICPRTKELIQKERDAGNDVIIVTSRYGPEPAFGQDNEDLFKIARELDFEDVYFTNGEKKVDTLHELGVEKHYDNDQGEINAIKKHKGPNIKTVKHIAGEKKQHHIKILIKKIILQELEAYQRKVRRGYVKKRNRYLSGGPQKTGGAPYTIKPKQTRSKSAPPGFGGTEE